MTKKIPLELHKKSGKATAPKDTAFLNRIAALIARNGVSSIHMAIKKLLGWKPGDHAIDGDSEVRRMRYIWDRSIKATPPYVSPPEWGSELPAEVPKSLLDRAKLFTQKLAKTKAKH